MQSITGNALDISFSDITRKANHSVHEAWRDAVKRTFDLVASFFGLLFLSPLFLFVAWRIKRDSPGPIFYGGRRVGLDGVEFKILKFRTMYERPESYAGSPLTAQDDNRITPIGRWLRDSKINELPQLWNVLVGEMSLVGPRPEDPNIAAAWPDCVRQVILSVRPGITSPASVIYRDEEQMLSATSAMDAYLGDILPKKMRLDQLYVRNHGMFTDLDVIFLTFIMLIPRIRDTIIQERLLFAGPLYNIYFRYVTWFAVDTLVAFLAISAAGAFWRLNQPLNLGFGPAVLIALAMAFTLAITNTIYGLKRITWRYASPINAIDLGVSTFSAILLLAYFDSQILPERFIPLTLLADIGVLCYGGFLVTRYRERLITGLASRWVTVRRQRSAVGERVLIVGAGECGELAVWLLNKSKYAHAFTVAGFVDDDYHKYNYRINDYPILGTTSDIPDQVAARNIGLILFAISKCSLEERERILASCQQTAAHVVIVPDLMDVLENSMLKQIQKVT